MKERKPTKRRHDRALTVSILDKEVEGVTIAAVSEPVVGGRQPLKTLRCDIHEVALELRVLRQDHRSPRHEAIDQRLLPHLPPFCQTLDSCKISNSTGNRFIQDREPQGSERKVSPPHK